MKSFRIYTSEGTTKVVKAKSMTFKKVNGSLSVKFDRNPKIEGVIALVEVTKSNNFMVPIKNETQNDD